MKTKMAAVFGMMAIALTACGGGGTVTVSTPTTYYCEYVYDYYYDYWYEDCYYINDQGQTETTRDVVADVADQEAAELAAATKYFAEKFSLSDAQGQKVASVIRDFNRLENRTEQDVASFAERLYGVNTSELAGAVAKAQVGDNSKLDEVVSKAAQNFQTSESNMKSIVNYLHGKALRDAGINL